MQPENLNIPNQELEPTVSFSWDLETEINKVQIYEDKLNKILLGLGWEKEDVDAVSLNFREWVINAIVHGNMALKKQQIPKDEYWEKWITANQGKYRNKQKTVGVQLRANRHRVVIEIQDQGKNSPEFWKNVKDATASENLLNTSGRGILISQKMLNSIDFEKNKQGVKVTLVRDLTKPLPINEI